MRQNPNATRARVSIRSLAGVVGAIAFVEFTSGFIQGYYSPMMTDIARHLQIHDAEVNWFESSHLMLAVLILPVFSKLGDMFGYRRMLLWAVGLTAVSTAILPFTNSFWTFLAAWTFQTFYSVWLPLNVAIIWSRARGTKNAEVLTAAATGVLVAVLQFGGIVGSVVGGVLVDHVSLWKVLLVPTGIVVAAFLVAAAGVRSPGSPPGGQLDFKGLGLLSVSLISLTGGLSLLRLFGLASPVAWLVVAVGALLFLPFARYEEGTRNPLIDIRLLRSKNLAPVFFTAALFGISVLGAQAPMSTFLRTDPDEFGYGLGASGTTASLMIGLYLVAIALGALTFPRIRRRMAPTQVMMVATFLVFFGYVLLLPFHRVLWQIALGMVIAGVGSGVLMAALPATVATEAPDDRTGMATGLTNLAKLVGGAIGSAIFGAVLMANGSESAGTAAPLEGYVVVWTVCGGSALLAMFALMVWNRRNRDSKS